MRLRRETSPRSHGNSSTFLVPRNMTKGCKSSSNPTWAKDQGKSSTNWKRPSVRSPRYRRQVPKPQYPTRPLNPTRTSILRKWVLSHDTHMYIWILSRHIPCGWSHICTNYFISVSDAVKSHASLIPTLSTYSHETIDLSVLSDFPCCATIPSAQGWLPLAMTDPALFHSLLCGVLLYMDFLAGRRDSPLRFKHMNESVRLLNIRLQVDHPQLSGGTVAAVVHLAEFEVSPLDIYFGY